MEKILKPSAPPAYTHEWQLAVLKGRDLEDLEDVNAKGPQLFGKRLFLTGVEGVDKSGQAYHWAKRRHRKGRLTRHEAHSLKQRPAWSWFGWLAFWQYHDTPQRAISWWIAAAFFYGSILFTIGGAAELSKKVLASQTLGRGSLDDRLISYPYVFGACLFFWPGVWLLIIETANTDWDLRLHNWNAAGRPSPRPRFRWLFPVKIDNFMWWASLLMFSGATGFNIATISSVVQVDWKKQWSLSKQSWLIFFPLTYGGAAFTLASFPFCFEASHSFYKGLVPLSYRDIRSLSFWTNAFQLWGSIGFVISGACYYDTSISFADQELEFTFGYLMGSIFFLLNGFCLYLELANSSHT